MITREQITRLLQAPAENTTVDYKLRLDWKRKSAQLELLRDLACLANRSGGFIGVGVKQISGARLEKVGLAEDDPLPDPTKLAALFREYFAPTVPIEVVEDTVDGKAIGFIAVGQFESSPIICRKNGGDETRTILRRGAIYVRSDAAACEEASAEDVDRMLNRALEHRAGSFRRIAQTIDESTPLARTAPRPSVTTDSRSTTFTHEALPPTATLRAADFFPIGGIQPPLRISEIETLLERSRVRGGGSSFFPRYIDRVDERDVSVFRHPDRLVLAADREALDTELHSAVVASLARDGVVRVRETLWEDTHTPATSDGRKRLGLSAMIGFAIAALLFAHRYYGSVGIARFRTRIGLVAPEGRNLWMDSNRRYPLMQAFRATTTEDLFLERELALEAVDTLDKRKEIAFALTSELFDFFGFRLSRDLFDGLVGDLGFVEMDGEPPRPLRL